ncbi:Arm DNA-binding domain-containing protein [Neobacillus sp. KR4-4]|uniref:Arm DNA-binding domain-containing protein n=1 Tax=Neobacillus sp. KR4-4 TaxID=3344872 RepID=UPI0035CAFBE7
MNNYYPKKNPNNNTYYFVLEAGKDSNGKRKRLRRSGFKTKVEARKAMVQLLIEVKGSLDY